ncbi:NAD(P)H-hydrate dehydratase [Anaerostipes sp. MSJ-23]|uniref:NAD(P)H-hydrate dehydratase n=1 Tax=unclassified Anaerostipes TaxID=2635253 RepID=UPI001C113212|nr:NAD(P)H-hydrate dehydratase [Anaerostipes sp. MSJ-23]MBU5460094.1 NAD(P)H-hydrate dehydratase [Anaerostipes sp. MSJ-23]
MRYDVLKNEEMQAVDNETIHKMKIPGLVLMERASFEVAQCVKKYAKNDARILVVAGIGNNGGDALACARILLEDGYNVDYIIVGKKEKASDDLKLQHTILENLDYSEKTSVNFSDYDVIVEGIFGVGLSRDVGGIYQNAIEQINQSKTMVISVDIPSGISGDSGKILGCAVRADHTVTFGGYKRGQLLYPGREYCGIIHLKSIGFHDKTIKKYASAMTLEGNGRDLMPERSADSNKGSYGKILIVAGNETMSGAASFASEAALRMGAGLVKVLSDEGNRQILQTRIPEILFANRSQLEQSLNWCDCILFGPGVGVSQETKEMLEMIFACGKKPLVIDADGLNTISRYKIETDYTPGLILTPHLMEASRLLSKPISQIKENLCQTALDLCEKFHATAVLKDAATIVAHDGQKLYINQSGNHGMATGGSGDVLAGMITGLLGGGLSAYEAAIRGVYLHGSAGDLAKEKKGPYSMIASDIIDEIKNITKGD